MTSIESADLNLGSKNIPFKLFSSSKQLIYDIFSGKTYPHVTFLKNVQIILDVGANVGAASAFFRFVHPDAQIYAFEPYSECFALLSENIDHIDGVQAFNFGLHEQDKTAELHISKFDYGTNSIGTCVHNSANTESIILKNALETVQDLGIKTIDILKVDTEGCELPILSSLLPVYYPQAVYLEYHSDSDRQAIDAMLSKDYLLFTGSIPSPHRGELCYVRRSVIPEDEESHRIEIKS